MFYLIQKIIRRKNRSSNEFDSSAMADLAFLLLIFFIVTSSFILPKGINLILPSDKKKPQQIKKNELISLEPQEVGYKLNQNIISENEISKKLLELNQDSIIIISMPSEVTYKRFISTLSLLKKNKFTKISIQESKI